MWGKVSYSVSVYQVFKVILIWLALLKILALLKLIIENHSNLFWPSVKDKEKSCMTLTPVANLVQLFFFINDVGAE